MFFFSFLSHSPTSLCMLCWRTQSFWHTDNVQTHFPHIVQVCACVCASQRIQARVNPLICFKATVNDCQHYWSAYRWFYSVFTLKGDHVCLLIMIRYNRNHVSLQHFPEDIAVSFNLLPTFLSLQLFCFHLPALISVVSDHSRQLLSGKSSCNSLCATNQHRARKKNQLRSKKVNTGVFSSWRAWYLLIRRLQRERMLGSGVPLPDGRKL